MTDLGSLRGARVLVTGAAGFIGLHLVRRLALGGVDVHAITRENCDLSDEFAVRRMIGETKPDFVFHLAAARTHSNSAERTATATVNTFSGLWLMESLPASCRAVVQLGSSTEYAQSRQLMDESTPLRPRGFFGATKAAGSLLTTASAAQRGIPCCILRCFQVYGPNDKAHRLVPTVLSAARDGTRVDLTEPGMRRDWVWVGDVVDACVRAATRASPGLPVVYNIGTGVQTTNEQLLALAAEVAGRPIASRIGTFPNREWDTDCWVSDWSAALRDLGWTPTVDLASGLKRCWEAL